MGRRADGYMPGVPLRLLRPKWLAVGEGREHMGLELDCPRHPDTHRVAIWFQNPGDGGPPVEGHSNLWWLATCCELDELTVVPAFGAPYRPIKLGYCWSGWVIDGELQEMRIVGVGW